MWSERVFSSDVSQNAADGAETGGNPYVVDGTRCACPLCLGLAVDNGDGGGSGTNAEDRGGPGTGTLPSYSIEAAAIQIARYGWAWGTGPGAVVTFAFRDTAPTTMPEDTAGFTQFTQIQIQQTLLALQTWSDVANITFTRVGGDGYSNEATLLFGNYSSGSDGAAAFAFLPNDPATTASSGDVWVNNSLSYNANPSYLNYGRHTLVHEIGHALGLRHPGDYDASEGDPTYADSTYQEDTRQYSVMSYWSEQNTGGFFRGAYASAPLLDDIAAMQLLYGPNMTTRVTDTVYGFGSNAGRDFLNIAGQSIAPIFAVWDAGGFDTLDFSGYHMDQLIDLRQGHFSNVGGLTGNVAIAQGTVIECAVGGAGNDQIYAQAYAVPIAVADLAKAQSQSISSIATALSLDGTFDRLFDRNIISSTVIPHTTVQATSNGTLEYYRFTGTAGQNVTVDVDAVANGLRSSADPVVRIYDSNNNLLASNDDGPRDVGSAYTQDSLLSFSLPANGVYYIVVGNWASGGTEDHVGQGPLPAGQTYTLHVSLSGVSTLGEAPTGSLLDGGSGNDILYGNIGDDVLIGGLGDDRLLGGAGFDYADYRGTNGGVIVDLSLHMASGAAGSDEIYEVEGINGSIDDDKLIGDAGVNRIYGGGGDDFLWGGGGDDVLDGGAGIDTAVYGSARRMYVANSASISGGTEGTDSLSIENLSFVDGTLTFDASSQAAQVMRMYDAALARQSDQGGFESWLDRLEGGLTLTQMAQAFLDSAEFQANFGGLSNYDYAVQLYRTTLRREPDLGGVTIWTAQLDNGLMTRTDMLVAFSESDEHIVNTASVLNQGLWVADDQAKIIARLYDATFDRLADAGGLAAWIDILKDGRPLIDIAAAFATAPEFQQRYGTLSNQDFVAQLYRFTLDREPDAGGLATWTGRLDSGSMSRAEMLLTFSESAEHVNLTAHLWLGGIQVFGGYNAAAPAEAGKALEAIEGFRDPIVVGGLPDDDAFIVPAGLDLNAQTLPALADHKPSAPHAAAVETLPAAWFDALPADLGHDLAHDIVRADLHGVAANDADPVHRLQDHAWIV